MALSLVLMIGLIGAVVGSNLIGVLLSMHCTTVFYIFDCILFCAAFSTYNILNRIEKSLSASPTVRYSRIDLGVDSTPNT